MFTSAQPQQVDTKRVPLRATTKTGLGCLGLGCLGLGCLLFVILWQHATGSKKHATRNKSRATKDADRNWWKTFKASENLVGHSPSPQTTSTEKDNTEKSADTVADKPEESVHKSEDKPADADKADGTTTVGLVLPSKRGNWRFALPAAAAAAALLGPVDGQGVSFITEGYQNAAESDVSADSFNWSADANTCMISGTVTPADGPERHAVQVVKSNGATTPTQQADSGSIIIPEFYGCEDMVRSDDGSANVATFKAMLWECLNGNCAYAAGGHHEVTVTATFSSGVGFFGRQPVIGERQHTDNVSDSYEGAVDQFYFVEGSTNPTPLPEGGFMPSHTDLHQRYSVPELNDDSVVILLNESVSFAGGQPEVLYRDGCQVSEQLHSTTAAPDRQHFTTVKDPIKIGHEGGYGGVVNQETYIAVVPANAVPFSSDELSTNQDKLCRSMTVLLHGRRLEEVLPAGVAISKLQSTYSVYRGAPPNEVQEVMVFASGRVTLPLDASSLVDGALPANDATVDEVNDYPIAGLLRNGLSIALDVDPAAITITSLTVSSSEGRRRLQDGGIEVGYVVEVTAAEATAGQYRVDSDTSLTVPDIIIPAEMTSEGVEIIIAGEDIAVANPTFETSAEPAGVDVKTNPSEKPIVFTETTIIVAMITVMVSFTSIAMFCCWVCATIATKKVAVHAEPGLDTVKVGPSVCHDIIVATAPDEDPEDTDDNLTAETAPTDIPEDTKFDPTPPPRRLEPIDGCSFRCNVAFRQP